MGPYIRETTRSYPEAADVKGSPTAPSVTANIAAAIESLEHSIKRLHGILGRIRGATPEGPDRGDAPQRIGHAPLIEQLERHARLINEFQALIGQLEDYV